MPCSGKEYVIPIRPVKKSKSFFSDRPYAGVYHSHTIHTALALFDSGFVEPQAVCHY